jgi:hypothetical protein
MGLRPTIVPSHWRWVISAIALNSAQAVKLSGWSAIARASSEDIQDLFYPHAPLSLLETPEALGHHHRPSEVFDFARWTQLQLCSPVYFRLTGRDFPRYQGTEQKLPNRCARS